MVTTSTSIMIRGDADREHAAACCRAAPRNARVDINTAQRTKDQNSMMWPLLTDIARQVTWHGRRLTPDEWKQMFLAALQGEADLVPGLDGKGCVNLLRSSSALRKAEFSDLLELILSWGARHGVVFTGEGKL